VRPFKAQGSVKKPAKRIEAEMKAANETKDGRRSKLVLIQLAVLMGPLFFSGGGRKKVIFDK